MEQKQNLKIEKLHNFINDFSRLVEASCDCRNKSQQWWDHIAQRQEDIVKKYKDIPVTREIIIKWTEALISAERE